MMGISVRLRMSYYISYACTILNLKKSSELQIRILVRTQIRIEWNGTYLALLAQTI